MRQLTVAVDMDGTICNTMAAAIQIALSHYGLTKEYTLNDFCAYDFKSCWLYMGDAERMWKAWGHKGLFLAAPAHEGAVEFIHKIIDRPEKYKLLFVTHVVENWVFALKEKVDWLKERFLFDYNKQFVMTKDRTNIALDVLVDDCLDNIRPFVNRPNQHVLMMARPWNHNLGNDILGAKNITVHSNFRSVWGQLEGIHGRMQEM